jgi:hypothetical protein
MPVCSGADIDVDRMKWESEKIFLCSNFANSFLKICESKNENELEIYVTGFLNRWHYIRLVQISLVGNLRGKCGVQEEE